MSLIISITETAKQDYYTLHVPGCEHYFANGILHHNSGKTFLICRAIAIRAMRAAHSRHAIFRYRFNAVKTSVWYDTWPKMMRTCFPDQGYTPNKTDFFYTFPNKAEVWLSGLDDKDRVEKVLGQEHASIFLNECSQISFDAREMVRTRLAQKVMAKMPGDVEAPLPLRMYYDENPPRKTHWSYRLFIGGVHPQPPNGRLPDFQDNYRHLQMNPIHNLENLSQSYIDELETLSPRQRKRFYEGEFGDQGEGQLWDYEVFEKYRVTSAPDLLRIAVAVDPSGTKGEEGSSSDDVGIIVVGVGYNGHGYILEDITVNASPAVWGRVVVEAFMRHQADVVVGEVNFGGAMVEHVVKTAAAKVDAIVPYVEVRASRGKVVRAEPASALYASGKVHHVGVHAPLEDQLSDMTTHGFMGDNSPDRADAAIWGLSHLFPALVRKANKPGSDKPIDVESPLAGF